MARTGLVYHPLLIVALTVGLATSGYARLSSADDIELDDEEVEFALPVPATADENSDTKDIHWLREAAHFTWRHELAYGVEDPQDLVINRSSLRLQWEQDFARHWFVRVDGKQAYDFAYSDDRYSADTRSLYRHTANIRELYLQFSKDNWSLRLGKQIVVWGKADGGIITDILSPRDLTESVFTSVEDARRGQNMLVMDYYHSAAHSGQQQWSVIINPDRKTNEFARLDHPYAVPSFTSSTVTDQQPGFSLRRPEFGIRWSRTRDKLDTSLMLAEVNDDNPVLSLSPSPGAPQLQTRYPRYQMLGGGFNLGQGNFVWKGELAWKFNRHFVASTANPVQALMDVATQTIDSALGFDYDASGLYSASLELTNQHILHWNNRFTGIHRDESVLYGTLSKNYLNDTLTLQGTSALQLQNGNSFVRAEAIYDLRDNWELALQGDAFIINKQDQALGQLQGKHRIELRLDFDF